MFHIPKSICSRVDILKRKFGFTLVELLVVVSVIALLLALLLPVLKQARVAAQMAKCASNQRQIMLATVVLLEERKDRFFDPNVYIHGGSWNDANWPLYLIPYFTPPMGYVWASPPYSIGPYSDPRVDNGGTFQKHDGRPINDRTTVYTCPSELNVWGINTSPGAGNIRGGGNIALNHHLIGMTLPDWPNSNILGLYYGKTRRFTLLKRPSSSIAYHDATYEYGGPEYSPIQTDFRLSRTDAGYYAYFLGTVPYGIRSMWRAHNQIHQAAFADGHVGNFKQETFPKDAWLID